MAKLVFGGAAVIALLAYCAFYIYTGGKGIYLWGGAGWLSGAIFAALFMRIMFPFTLGAFYFASQEWGLHWTFASVWALPGLAVALPSAVAGIYGWSRDNFGDLFRSRAQREAEEEAAQQRLAYMREFFEQQKRE